MEMPKFQHCSSWLYTFDVEEAEEESKKLQQGQTLEAIIICYKRRKIWDSFADIILIYSTVQIKDYSIPFVSFSMPEKHDLHQNIFAPSY